MVYSSVPTVAIGLPVYNGEAYIEQALRSLLAQTYNDFEVIVCDNASTDRTAEICRAIAEQDPRVRYIRNRENVGLAANWNKAFEFSRSPFFKWHAYDDLCAPTFLEECMDQFRRDPGISCAYSLAIMTDHGGLLAREPFEPSLMKHLASPNPRIRLRAAILLHGWSGVVHGVFRREVLADFMPYKDYFGADRLLLTQLATSGRSAAVKPGLFIQRYHTNNTSTRSTRELAELLTGRKPRGLIFPAGRAIIDYLRLFKASHHSPITKLVATWYLFRHGLRTTVLKNLLLPGKHNYFGLELGLIRSESRSKNRPAVPEKSGVEKDSEVVTVS